MQGFFRPSHLVSQPGFLGTDPGRLLRHGLRIPAIAGRQWFVAVAHPLGRDRGGGGDAFGQRCQRIPVLLGYGRPGSEFLQGELGGPLGIPGLRQFGFGLPSARLPGLVSGIIRFEGEPGLRQLVGKQSAAGIAQFRLNGGGPARHGGLPAQGLQLPSDLG